MNAGTHGARVETEPAALDVRGLRTVFEGEAGAVAAVDGVDFRVEPGRTLGLVGESGCGKSVTALSILGLVPEPGSVVGGEIRWRGRDLARLGPGELRRVRGGEIAMIFQEPTSALNPVLSVGAQVAEAVRIHQGLDRRAARRKAVEMLARVGLADAERRARDYPHRLSGGMCQRVMIAMAIACEPALLLADEPTTALDPTVQAQILDLIRDVQRASGMGVLLISHDLGVVAETADEVCVMYAGRIVERAPVVELFERPRHPYTIGLLRSLPSVATPGSRLPAIEGTVPEPGAYPSGCRFRTRCPIAREECARRDPALEAHGRPPALVACHFPGEHP